MAFLLQSSQAVFTTWLLCFRRQVGIRCQVSGVRLQGEFCWQTTSGSVAGVAGCWLLAAGLFCSLVACSLKLTAQGSQLVSGFSCYLLLASCYCPHRNLSFAIKFSSGYEIYPGCVHPAGVQTQPSCLQLTACANSIRILQNWSAQRTACRQRHRGKWCTG